MANLQTEEAAEATNSPLNAYSLPIAVSRPVVCEAR